MAHDGNRSYTSYTRAADRWGRSETGEGKYRALERENAARYIIHCRSTRIQPWGASPHAPPSTCDTAPGCVFPQNQPQWDTADRSHRIRKQPGGQCAVHTSRKRLQIGQSPVYGKVKQRRLYRDGSTLKSQSIPIFLQRHRTQCVSIHESLINKRAYLAEKLAASPQIIIVGHSLCRDFRPLVYRPCVITVDIGIDLRPQANRAWHG